MVPILPIFVVFFWPLSDGTGEFLKDFSFDFGSIVCLPYEESMESFGLVFPFEFFEFFDEADLRRAACSSVGVPEH